MHTCIKGRRSGGVKKREEKRKGRKEGRGKKKEIERKFDNYLKKR